MIIRKYEEHNDYPLLSSWYSKRFLEAPMKQYLPKNGYIIEDKMAVFICSTDTIFCVLEYYICDPETAKEERTLLSDTLLDYVISEVKSMGYFRIFNFVGHKGSIDVLTRNKFKQEPDDVKIFSKDLF